MKTTLNYLLFLCCMLPSFLFAQSQLSGVVTEESSSLPLPGVNVIIKGTTSGTATDFDGNYQLNVNNGDVIVFSYVGYITQEITYTGQSTLNVSMVEDAAKLDEVVIIGYGAVKKDDLTGTADMVTSEDFNKGPIVSAQQLITGKVAGVSITSGSGAPGEGQDIRIRGTGSLSLSSNPLIVIDGIPINNDAVGGARNPLNLVNPNDIESMVVLKDASATAIYGSRGGNGVILITTKKGKDNDFKFNLNSSTTHHTSNATVDLLNADQFREVVANHPRANEATLALLGNANTDWQDEIYSNAFGQDHNFSALGSAWGVPMRASLGYSDHDGILKRDNFKRTTGSLSFTPKLFDDHLKIELNAKGQYTENFFGNRGAIGSANVYDPTQPVYNADGSYFDWVDGTGTHISLSPINPVAQLNLVDDTSEVRRFLGNAKMDYKFHFLPELTATVNLGLDKSNSAGRTVTSEEYPSTDPDWIGSRNEYSQERTDQLLDAYLTYNKSFNDEAHNLNVVAGYSYQSFEFDGYSYSSIDEQNAIENPDADIQFEYIDRSKSVLLSYFGRLNYDYKGRYLLTATFRADASSKLNSNDRWGYFPSAALAWNLKKEEFMEDSGVTELKLRVGYGTVGNVNGLGDYLFLTRYTGSNSFATYLFGNNYYPTYRPDAINKDLKWEVSETFNVGLDYGFAENRIKGSVNAYIRKSNDLIATSTVDPFTNFSNRIAANIGDMENKGVEFDLTVIPVRTEDFEWSVNYNVSFNDNEVTRMPDQQYVGGISGGVGNNIQTHIEGEAPYSFLVFQQIYDENGDPIEGAFVDRNGDNVINDADKFIYKDPYADVLMGLNTNVYYKNWDLSVQTRASIGNYAYNNVASGNAYLNNVIPSSNNYLSNIHSEYLNSGFQQITDNTLLSNYFIQDASFFRIDNITLGHTLNHAIKDTTIRLYGSIQNVAVFTDYDGLDPEINGGIDNSFYPRPRSFVFGVNIDF
ncbi:TonB-dependent receptor [Mangrovimonas sp. YM274]|uniref:SusC/RagA family TonB-linked outer membrane protein n=1 Tax=Mangrovimonas sp. YM274 TaxID=3070660 RepID=UPI0027DBBA76|nr:TonB-dependent receptor [Mangrovimonas sp. YM274]WMI68550.1 TonB-dependent receptor [Mangrovimonas sp. YM274]